MLNYILNLDRENITVIVVSLAYVNIELLCKYFFKSRVNTDILKYLFKSRINVKVFVPLLLSASVTESPGGGFDTSSGLMLAALIILPLLILLPTFIASSTSMDGESSGSGFGRNSMRNRNSIMN